ncbi:adenylate kinase 8 [Polypterus senegalus]|uniref:adenylate kinase 8 n=1 Tax=Polypterus senegalus TaxID=55291 RepID=UPI00196422AE|nr:adenylate kinase 8 [Polypterus senegalus]
MDQTARPLRIPPEMGTYAEKHGIFDLMQTILSRLLVDKPQDPVEYLLDLLKRGNFEVPQIFVLGPPAAGKKTIAKMLCEQLGATYISPDNLLAQDSNVVKEALEFHNKKQDIPNVLWIKLVEERLSKMDCIKRGWLLEGFPKTREQAVLLQEKGISPEHVVFLEAPDAVLIERNLGKRVDPETGAVYHTTFDWPSNEEVQGRLVEPPGISEEETANKLLEYRRNNQALENTYRYVHKVFNADQPCIDVFSQVLTFVLSRHRSVAPFTPRILLFGSPGSGKSLQAELLSQKYNIVNICCGQLLKAVVADETSLGELIKPYLENGEQVPDTIVLKILTQRLSKLDCTTQGWVLHDFPRDLDQAEKLNDAGFIPNRVFFLDLPNELCIERLTLRAIDPVTGDRYHYLYKAAPSQQVQSRLQRNPRDSEEDLLRRLAIHHENIHDLQEFYRDAVHVNADQDPHSVFEVLESRLVNRPPKTVKRQPLTHF